VASLSLVGGSFAGAFEEFVDVGEGAGRQLLLHRDDIVLSLLFHWSVSFC
jgi:hypothetical protein